MPTKITDKHNNEVAWLCDEQWELPAQIEALEQWLLQDGKELQKGSYVADIGFSPRPGASGGGGVVSLAALQVMVSVGMELALSEYPEFNDEQPDQP